MNKELQARTEADSSTTDALLTSANLAQSPLLGVVFLVTDSSNYYGEPVTIRVFDSKEKAIEFCKLKNNPDTYSWEEMEVE